MSRRYLARPSLLLQLLLPSVVAVVLCTGLVQRWTLWTGGRAIDEGAQRNLQASMGLLRAYLDPLGSVWSRVDGQLRLGTVAIADRMDIVDRAATAAGGVATVFNGDVRIATNVKKPDGTRAVGTKLTDPVVREAVLSAGVPFQGRTNILGQEYATIYEPIRDAGGNLIGVLFTGIPTAPLEAWKAEIAWNAVLAGTVLTIAFAVLNGILMVRTLRPLNGLALATRKIADGDLSGDIPSLDRQDQLGALAASLAVFKDAATEKLRLEAARRTAAEEQSVVVAAVAEGLERVAAGDLVVRLDQPFAAEYEALRHHFNTAIAGLQDAMRAIAANARGVRAGSHDVSRATEELSRRTEQQSASIERTAATLDEITATVRRTAEGSQHALVVVTNTKGDAEQSGSVVREAVAAMGEIERSSQQIGRVIGVIDEIAFQTNLLALNAGVEAARAGDSGRGFAVVASEVRALAQRSAEAAKEIKGLVTASAQQVEAGVTLVARAGEALSRIVAQVADIKGAADEIASAAQEQSVGLVEVNADVNRIDQATQENAAMVGESAAASQALANKAEELAHLTSRFQLGHEDEPPNDVQAPPRPAKPQRRAAKSALTVVGADGGSAARKTVAV